MATGRKITKLEIESVDGTLMDMTPFVGNVSIVENKPSLWQRIKDWWTYRKLRKMIQKDVTIEFVGVYDPYAEYKHLHRN